MEEGAMERQQIQDKIKEILVEDLKIQGVAPADITGTAPLFGEEGLGLDSLDAVELVVLVQKYFSVQIATMEEGQEAFRSVEALAEYIIRQRGEKK